MKNVYILFGGYDYEDSTTLGVFATKAEAEEIKKWGEENRTGPNPDHQSLRFGFDSLWIEEHTVGERLGVLAAVPK